MALSINPQPLSVLQLKLSGLIMASRVDTAVDNQNPHVIISNYFMLVSEIRKFLGEMKIDLKLYTIFIYTVCKFVLSPIKYQLPSF